MAIYTVGRRRVIVALLLTLVLLLTLDLRGNPVLDRVRDGFARAMAPIESATDVITTPVSRAWNGVTQYDDLERENEALQDQLDRLIGTQATARLSVEEAAELKALLSLNSLAGIPTEVAKVVGASSNNLDQIIEIDIGRTRGVRVGMPVVNQAGLIGKITSVTDNTAKVMLITDSRYVVPVRVQAAPAADLGPTDTRPSGRTNEELEDLVATTLVTDVLASESSLPQNDGANGDPASVDDPTSGDLPVNATSTTLDPNDGESPAGALPVDGEVIETTTTTTTTTVPNLTAKEFGALEGRGRGLIPQIRFLQDNPSLAVLQEGDLVVTAGGFDSLAPPDIPIGVAVNRADRSGPGGPLLDVQPYADVTRLNFLRVVLYTPLSEVERE
ncbi:MAG: rod shape-determining protein MreC [Ilumatobacter sp.]|jgi:rod shape-determining protein MreC|uniref:rod shape-determining protein MreC n=1 Tax=Ilumatobacter sp. TaxID=1967498 RepID=UPI001D1E4C61|nr:rod shape-determining protein MreC [Ilumatobacter sp.]MBT5275459.1 rod shape-determining protein MreC [Ilumatobacter sp.]MBT5554841.1 rod shape-determining protein MreC [Ilumatobacter sp.]MBT5864277.1 rod shape-determining protein MreC [Ilumatobacter sp.]MDG0978037.1 rod shape-determining protein MreC [Ilumatobacter sp.]